MYIYNLSDFWGGYTDSIKLRDKFIPVKKDKYCENIEAGYYLFCLEKMIPFAFIKYTDLDKVKVKTFKIIIY